MNKMKTGNVLLILALMFWSQQIWALGCTLRNGLTTKNINLQSIVVQRDAPIGTVLATVPVPSSGTTLGDCQAGGYSYGGILPYASTAVGNNVYQTATPGIGIRVSQMYAANGSFVPSSASFNGPVSFADQPVTVEVIKTGNMQSGQMNSGVVAQYRWTGTSPGWITAMQIQFAAPVRVTVLSCSVNTPNLAVPMGDFLNTDFPNIGATSPAVMASHSDSRWEKPLRWLKHRVLKVSALRTRRGLKPISVATHWFLISAHIVRTMSRSTQKHCLITWKYR